MTPMAGPSRPSARRVFSRAVPIGGLAAVAASGVASAHGPVLAFCRSGTRSCNLWALAQARNGADADELIAKGAGAGYNLDGLRPLLDQLKAQA